MHANYKASNDPQKQQQQQAEQKQQPRKEKRRKKKWYNILWINSRERQVDHRRCRCQRSRPRQRRRQSKAQAHEYRQCTVECVHQFVVNTCKKKRW